MNEYLCRLKFSYPFLSASSNLCHPLTILISLNYTALNSK